jgi:hypothetical protein
MRLAFVGIALALLVTACKPDAATIQTFCTRENALHTVYMAYIAPDRPPEKVAKAIEWHYKAQALCQAGVDIAGIIEAMRAADAARSE